MKNQNLPVEEARIRRLLAAGCPVPAENHSTGAPGLVVEVHKPERTQAFDFRSSTEYILVVRITNNSYARLKMKTLEGYPLWEDENFTWLGDCRRYRPEKKAYRMPSGREIPYESVLNHCIREMNSRLENPGKAFYWRGAWTRGFRLITSKVKPSPCILRYSTSSGDLTLRSSKFGLTAVPR